MASLTCAISNEVPECPVVSPVSGQVYEKRLIEKYIQESGVDPVSKEPLSVEQLIELKWSPLVKPKPPSATSIPAILKSLQDEWDAVMLHSFTLRQQLQTARQELSHALYQHDAACRVIARLNKEVTAAREALATLKPQAQAAATPIMTPSHGAPATPSHEPATPGSTPAGGVGAEQALGMTPDIVEQLQEKANVLTQERKKRGKTVPEGLITTEQIKQFNTQASHPGIHSASVPGILCLDISQGDSNKILTGGADKNAVVFNKSLEQVVSVLSGHTKKVVRAVYHPAANQQDTVITASHDTTIRVWSVNNATTSQVLRVHSGPVTGLSLHATGDYVLSTSSDMNWAFSDIRSGRLVARVQDNSQPTPLTCAQFHPDGLIFGTGTSEAQIKIWDLKEQLNVAEFSGHSGAISALAFSENGYYLATSADDSCVKLWDLRKLKNFKTLQLEDGYEVKDLCFDSSGTYLGVAGSDVKVYLCKQWTELKVFNDHTAMATGIRFGENSQFLASTSMDRTLKIYGE